MTHHNWVIWALSCIGIAGALLVIAFILFDRQTRTVLVLLLAAFAMLIIAWVPYP